MKKLKLTDLISVEALQRIQDGFSRYTGMAVLVFDSEGNHITNKSGFSRFCVRLTRKTDLGCRRCEECDKEGIARACKAGKAIVYSCHAGLMDFAAPIIVDGNFMGSFIGGQVRYAGIDKEALTATAIELGIDPAEYIRAAGETACIPSEVIEEAAVFLGEIANGVSAMAYGNYVALQESRHMENVAKSQADFVMNVSMNLEYLMGNWFKLIEDNLKKSQDEQTLMLLSQMHEQGKEIQESIKETIEYIRMSANKVELTETAYNFDELLGQINDGIGRHAEDASFITGIEVDDSVPKQLFGDEGRIGQMVNRLLRELLENKTDGSIAVRIYARDVSYSTNLFISFTDRISGLSPAERDEIRQFSKHNTYQQYQADTNAFGISFVLLILKRMSGSITMREDDNDVIIELCLPQLKLGGSA